MGAPQAALSPVVSSAATWAEDYDARMNPDLMTTLLRAAVPVLEQVGWRVTRVHEGGCESELPLNRQSTNQHGTHQAALISLAGDYTGGMAVASLLRGVPIAGVHPGTELNSAAIWLAGMAVRFKAPSTGHMTATCQIPTAVAEEIRRRYFAGERVLVTLTIGFVSNGEPVAEAEMTYFAQACANLRPTPQRPRLSVLYKHRLKASARMIAALRGRPTPGGDDALRCVHSARAAGPHGRLLADYLTSVLPQLHEMVAARTRHVDQVLKRAMERGVKQIVTAGVGLDFRAFRLGKMHPDATFYETDLPEMLEERERTIRAMPELPAIHRRTVPVNFDVDQLDAALLKSTDFDPSRPAVVLYEGCSMYFDEAANRRTLRHIRPLLGHPESCLWIDFVAKSVVDGSSGEPAIVRFLEGMARIGEAFVFGLDDPSPFLKSLGFRVAEAVSAQRYLGTADAVHAAYQFVVAGGSAGS